MLGVYERLSHVARPFSRRALSIRDDKRPRRRLSSGIDNALREKGLATRDYMTGRMQMFPVPLDRYTL